MNRTLVIIRHAHRDTCRGQGINNGLSDRGRRQVRKLFDHYFERFPELEKPLFLTSPKKRCVETLEPLARKLERKLNTEPLLEERGPRETSAEFKRRIRRFKKNWLESKEMLTVICSHGDWIPLFLKELLGASIQLKKGAWAEVELLEEPELTWLLQSF